MESQWGLSMRLLALREFLQRDLGSNQAVREALKDFAVNEDIAFIIAKSKEV